MKKKAANSKLNIADMWLILFDHVTYDTVGVMQMLYKPAGRDWLRMGWFYYAVLGINNVNVTYSMAELIGNVSSMTASGSVLACLF